MRTSCGWLVASRAVCAPGLPNKEFPYETAGWEKRSTRLVRNSYEIRACTKACF